MPNCGTVFAHLRTMRCFLFLLGVLGLVIGGSASAMPDTTGWDKGSWRPDRIPRDSALAMPMLPLRTATVTCAPEIERLVYAVRYGFISAGEARLETGPGPVYDGRPTWRVVGTGRSVGAFDWVFKVRDHYESHIDREGLFPHRFIRRVREGGYRMERDIIFDPARRTARTDEKEESHFQAVPAFCQDLVSAAHFARNLPLDTLEVGELVEIPTFVDGEVHIIRARMSGRSEVKVKAGTFDCWAFQPVVKEGRIWKDEDDLTLHVSADQWRIPVLVTSDLVIGSLRLELMGVYREP